jgi:gliding motility-associated-like protein
MGWHYLTITDAVGCVRVDSVRILAPPPLGIADTSITLVTCYGGSDGTARIVPNGGTLPYSFEWLVSPTQTSATATGLSVGWYSVVVTDGNGCHLDTTRIYVRQPFLPLDAQVSSEPPRCKDGSDGRLSVTPAFGGTAGYTYAWSTGDSTFNVFGVSAGQYELTITDAKNCTTIKQIEIENPDRFYFEIDITPVTCFDDSDGFVTVDTAYGGAGTPFAYGFNYGLFQNNPTFVDLPPMNLHVAVRDGNGCEQDTIITVPNAFELFVDAGSDETVYLGDSLRLQAVVNTTIPVTYSWDAAPNMSCTDCANPVIIPTEKEFYYTVTVIDSNGCTATDEVLINVIQQRKIFIPDAFTPNGDGINDVFLPYGGEGVVQIRSFQIYNRWGSLLHYRTNFAPNSGDFGWDGTIDGSTVAAPSVYVYVVEVEFIDGKVILYTGDVTLVR